MKIVTGAYWDVGRRENNQDSLLLEQVITGHRQVVLAVVCDGIGGLKEGENASGFMLEKVQACFYDQLLPMLSTGWRRRRIERCLLRCFFEANQIFQKYGAGREIELGTTVSLLLLAGRRYLLMQLGDSRVYGLARGQNTARQLTRDHAGGAHTLLKCMGSFPYQCPDSRWGRCRRKGGFLLCTDGFYRELSPGLLLETLNPEELEETGQVERRLKQLAQHALKKGETDNQTAVCVILQ